MKDWVCIFTSQKLQEAEIMKGVLSFNEINSVVISKQDSSHILLGEYELYVNREDVVKAKYVLEQNNNPS